MKKDFNFLFNIFFCIVYIMAKRSTFKYSWGGGANDIVCCVVVDL